MGTCCFNINNMYSPIIVVLSYFQKEENDLQRFLTSLKNSNIHIIPIQQENVRGINQLKNIGIDQVRTSHFIFVEFSFVPSSMFSEIFSFNPLESLYKVLKTTPGYLWRDQYFAGVVPVFEWSSNQYPKAKASFQSPSSLPLKLPDLQECIKDYTCRPLQTTTVSMVLWMISFLIIIAICYFFIHSLSQYELHWRWHWGIRDA